MSYNILLITHEISPIQGSECAQGWNIAIRLSKYNKVHVLYASGSQFNPQSYKAEIEKISHLYPNIEFLNLDQSNLGLTLSKINKLFFSKFSPIGNPILYFLIYNLWHKKAYHFSRNIIKAKNIHLIHLLTSISFREPGYFWKLNIPFVWGPTGGLTILPKSFIHSFSLKEKFIENLRSFFINYEFSRSRIKNAILKSSIIYTFSEFDKIKFLNSGGKKVFNLLDSGTIFLDLPILIPSEIINVVWAGQLVKRKSFNILLEAVVKLPDNIKSKFKFRILGTGILLNYFVDQVYKFNLSNHIIFEGQKNREDLFTILKNSDILVHTSYREATTNIIPEALSANLPVICHDISGMSIAINENCGFKIPLVNYDYSINELVKIFNIISNDFELLINLKKGAKQRSMEISWDKNAEIITDHYSEILN